MSNVEIGVEATVTMATRGREGPGKVTLPLNGTQAEFIAYSDKPLPVGTAVAVYRIRGTRTVDVEPLYQTGA